MGTDGNPENLRDEDEAGDDAHTRIHAGPKSLSRPAVVVLATLPPEYVLCVGRPIIDSGTP